MRSFRPAAFGASCALLALAASAQPVYRSVGPDGRVSYSDHAPNAQATPVASSAAAAPSSSALPPALRQVQQRYPVVLYSNSSCMPCDGGRALLQQRGIPFAEYTVHSAEDVEALRRLSPEGQLPLLTIGAQRLQGFSQQDWEQYLNAAGYPAQSQLPPSYRGPAPQPLVAPATAAAPSAPPAPSAPAARAPAPPRQTNGANPAGIIF